MADGFFSDVAKPIPFGGLDSTDPLSYKVYQPDRLVLGKRMEDHLRIAVCLWHSFAWPGSDVFGSGTFDRPWNDPRLEPMLAAEAKLDAAFEFVEKLGVPFFCFHDRDVSPEGHTYVQTQGYLDTVIGMIEDRMAQTGVRLLWGTANLFSHPRYAAGAATNPDPEVFAFAATQVKSMLEATHRLGGANYVLWGGREGYETLLNTDMAREEAQFGAVPAPWSPTTSIGSASRARFSSSPSRRSRPSTSTTTTARRSRASSSDTGWSTSTASTSR